MNIIVGSVYVYILNSLVSKLAVELLEFCFHVFRLGAKVEYLKNLAHYQSRSNSWWMAGVWRNVEVQGERFLKQCRLNFVANDSNGHIHEVDHGVSFRKCPLQSSSLDSLLKSKPIEGVNCWVWIVEPDSKSIVDESYKVENSGVQEG